MAIDYEVLGLASDGRHCLMIFCLGLHFFWSVSQMPMRRRSLFAHLMWLTTTRCSSLAPATFVSQRLAVAVLMLFLGRSAMALASRASVKLR
jgi:hypothetical protein